MAASETQCASCSAAFIATPMQLALYAAGRIQPSCRQCQRARQLKKQRDTYESHITALTSEPISWCGICCIIAPDPGFRCPIAERGCCGKRLRIHNLTSFRGEVFNAAQWRVIVNSLPLEYDDDAVRTAIADVRPQRAEPKSPRRRVRQSA